MSKTRFEEWDIPDERLFPIIAAWIAALFLVPIAGAILHANLAVTGLVMSLLSSLLIALIWRWSRPKGVV